MGVSGLEPVEVQPEPGEVGHRRQFADRQEAVQDSTLVQHFQGAGVHPAGPRLPRPFREPFDHQHIDARKPQLAREHQARGPGARDHHVRVHAGVSHVVSPSLRRASDLAESPPRSRNRNSRSRQLPCQDGQSATGLPVGLSRRQDSAQCETARNGRHAADRPITAGRDHAGTSQVPSDIAELGTRRQP